MSGNRQTRSMDLLTRSKSRKSGIPPRPAMDEPEQKKNKTTPSSSSDRSGSGSKKTNRTGNTANDQRPIESESFRDEDETGLEPQHTIDGNDYENASDNASTSSQATGNSDNVSGQSQASMLDLLAKFQRNPNHLNEKSNEPQIEIVEEPKRSQKKKKVHYEFRLEQTFDSEKSCDDFIEGEKCWSGKQKVWLNSGLKTIYRCHHVKLRGDQCSAGIYTMSNTKPDDQTFKLYRKVAEHDHEDSDNKVTAMTDEVKALVKQYVQLEHLTLKPILYRLRDMKDKIVQPEDYQVKSYIKRVKKELYGEAVVSLQDMVEYCKQNSQIPDDIDDAFVLDFEHSPLSSNSEEETDQDDDDDDDDEEDENSNVVPKGNWIRYIVTTKRLLMNSAQSKIVHSDATYKVVVQRFPVLNFGTTDQGDKQHFHLMGMMVSKYERTADYAFGFKALRDGVKKVTEKEFEPKVLMADAAAAIGNAFKKTFGNDTTIMMCFTHVISAVDRKRMGDQDNKAMIKADLRKLRFAPTKYAFDAACNLFIEKWSVHEPEFTEYFQKVWLDRNSNWFSGAHYRVPTTNNAMEGYHKHLKAYQLYWRQNGIGVFKVEHLRIISQRSKEYIQDKAVFQSEVNVTKAALKEGEKYAETKNVLFKQDPDGGEVLQCYMWGGDRTEPLTESDLQEFYAADSDNFDAYCDNWTRIYQQTFMNMDPTQWKHSQCTCPAFAQDFMCKHIVCVAYKLGILKPPKIDLLAPNSKRGRPKNMAKGLQRN